jgi:hypothetical protein
MLAGIDERKGPAMLLVLFVLAMGMTGAVVAAALETGAGDGTRIAIAGIELASGLTPRETTIALVGAAFACGLLGAWTLETLVRRRSTRRLKELAATIHEREAAIEARRTIVAGRIEDLQRAHDELLGRRDALLSEVERLSDRAAELEERIREQHRELARVRLELERAAAGDEVVVVPEPQAADTATDG